MKQNAEEQKIVTLSHNHEAIKILVRKSTRAKRLSIRISDGKGVELIVPKRVSMKYAMKFLNNKKDWVINRSYKIKPVKKNKLELGNCIPVLGSEYEIIHSGKKRGLTYIDSNKIVVSGEEAVVSGKATRFLKNFIKDVIANEVHNYSQKLDVKYNKVNIKDTVTRWGSCSSNKNLSFSWRLVFAPKEIVDYVVAHEVSHLVHMNHSKDFWGVVESIYPQYRLAIKWLRDNGSRLHCY